MANGAEKNPPDEAARSLRARRASPRARQLSSRWLRRHLLAVDRCRYEIWRPGRRNRNRETAHAKFVQLFSREARPRFAQAGLSSILRGVSGSSVHARVVARLLREGRHLSRPRPKLFLRPRSIALPRRCSRRGLRGAHRRRPEKSRTALSLLRTA